MSKEAMKLALEALGQLWLFSDEAAAIANPAITALREALVEQPAKQDIPDLIAGTLGVSRGTAYDLMREALAEQPAQQQEPPTVAELLCVCGAEWEWRNRDWELVATPPTLSLAQRQARSADTWVGLTYGEVLAQKKEDPIQFYRAIEAKLREKNT